MAGKFGPSVGIIALTTEIEHQIENKVGRNKILCDTFYAVIKCHLSSNL